MKVKNISTRIEKLTAKLPQFYTNCHSFSDQEVQPVFGAIAEFLIDLYNQYVVNEVLLIPDEEYNAKSNVLQLNNSVLPDGFPIPYTFLASSDKLEMPGR